VHLVGTDIVDVDEELDGGGNNQTAGSESPRDTFDLTIEAGNKRCRLALVSFGKTETAEQDLLQENGLFSSTKDMCGSDHRSAKAPSF
jgi:hypothetical protein